MFALCVSFMKQSEVNAAQVSVSLHFFLTKDGGVSVLYMCTREKYIHTVETT